MELADVPDSKSTALFLSPVCKACINTGLLKTKYFLGFNIPPPYPSNFQSWFMEWKLKKIVPK
jgi:hypothetical protein